MTVQDRGRIASPLIAGCAPPRSGAQGSGIFDHWTSGIYFCLIARSVSGCFIQERDTCKSQSLCVIKWTFITHACPIHTAFLAY